MKNNTAENSKVIEERIGKTVFFVGAKQSDGAKRSLEDKLKSLMINDLLMDDQFLPV